MALDKQRILNELGNVMNQLQSADCGCMGKIFSNPTQCSSDKQPMGHTLPSYGGYQRPCHHSHNHNQAPCQTFPTNAQGRSSCKGHCNPPQLYAETYNYLNEKLMKPVMKEVYDELRSINPSNTVTNNPLAAQMGLNVSQGNSGVGGNISLPNEMSNFRQDQVKPNGMLHEANGFLPVHPQFMQAIGGMGPQIENMMMGSKVSKNIAQSGTPINPASQQIGFTQDHYDISQIASPGVKDQNAMIVGQKQLQANSMKPINNVQQMQSNVQSPGEANFNPHHVYGQHAQGMQKFKETFPGLIQNDLGYDPMAIAIQMSHQNVPTSPVHGKSNVIMADGGKNMPLTTVPLTTQPEFNNNLRNNLTQFNQHQAQQNLHNNVTPINQLTSEQNSHNHVKPINQLQVQQNSDPINTLYQMPNVLSSISEQSVPPKAAGGLVNLQSASQMQHSPATQLSPQPEPIYPVETRVHTQPPSHIYTEFNTLGQPVENLPASAYQTPVQNLPQTLSPQPSPINRHGSSKIKSTISKTSLMGMKSIGRTKSQLQHIYRQYKGQQDHLSHSAGRLQEGQGNLKSSPLVGFEKIGDSTANNKVEIKHTELIKEETEDVSSKPGKLRNGLQDMVFSSRPISAAWTFHGQLTAPYSSIYRPYSSYARRCTKK